MLLSEDMVTLLRREDSWILIKVVEGNMVGMSDANGFNNKNRRQNHDSSKTCKVDSLLHFLRMKTILSQVSTFNTYVW